MTRDLPADAIAVAPPARLLKQTYINKMMKNKNIANLISIGISTKNRWLDLSITLQKIEDSDLKTVPILILDDASDTACSFDINKFDLNIELTRFTDSKGYIYRRNQLAQAIKTKYYFSLDDDSYPVAGSILEAVEFAESKNNLLSLSFPIYNPVIGEYQNLSLQKTPYQVRFFIGCGHLLNCQNFLQLGGYSEELIHQGEEMDIAAKAFQKGLVCYHFPQLEIHHTASNSGRNWQRMDFYGARNNVLWNDWFVPTQLKPLKYSRTFISHLFHSMKFGRFSPLQGELAGFKDIPKYKYKRQPMSLELYRLWQSLPYC